MASLQFVFGASGSGKTEYCIRRALLEAEKDLSRNVYYLVPEQDTLAMQKRIVLHKENKGKGILNLDVLSFQRLFYSSFTHLNRTVPKTLDEMGKLMVLSLVSEQLKKRRGRKEREEGESWESFSSTATLSYFQGEVEQLGFLEECKSLISECMQYGIRAEKLYSFAQKLKKNVSKRKIEDIALLYHGFLSWMTEQEKYTEESIAALALENIEQDPHFQGACFILDGFTGFTVSELHCLEFLLVGENQLLLSLEVRSHEEGNLYDKGDRSSLFYLTKNAVEEVESLALEKKAEILPSINLNCFDSVSGEKRKKGVVYPRFEKIPALQKVLDSYAFSSEGKEQEGSPIPPLGITVKECPDILREVQEAGNFIHHLVKDCGYRYRDIAVIIPDIASYRDVLFSKWKDLSIPFFLEEDITLFDSPYVKVIRAAFLVLEKGFLFDTVFRYLRAFPYRTAEEEEIVDCWENIARAKGWKGKTAFSSFLSEGQEDRRAYRDLASLLQFYERNTSGRGSKEALLLRERVESLVQLITDCALEERILSSLSFLKEEGMENREESYQRSIEEVQEITERITESLGDIPLSGKSFGKIFELAFSLEKLRQIPATLDQVLVGDLTRSRFHNPKAFLFLGCGSEFLPKKFGKTIIFTEKERELMREEGYRLSPLSWEESYIEKYYVYRAFLTPKEELYLSYPRTLRNGKGERASSYLRDFCALFPGLKIRIAENEKMPVYNALRGKEELVLSLPSLCRTDHIFVEKEELFHHFKLDSFRLLHYLWNKEAYHEETERLLSGIFFANRTVDLKKETALQLYGELIQGSVTRMERFHSCPYAHFLQYGLALKERKTSEVRAFDIGNLYHKMVELFFKRFLKKKGEEKVWEAAFQEALSENVNQAVEETLADPAFQRFLTGGRNQYLLRKLRFNGRRILWALGKQILGGDLRPDAVEEAFQFEEEGIFLRGRIDRVDRYLDQSENTVYLKVVDYKSGKKDFSLPAVYQGLDLQLPLYMEYVLERERKKNPSSRIVPSALFYFTMENPVLSYKEGEDYEKARLKALKPKGLVNLSEEGLSHLEKDGAEESLLLPIQKKEGNTEEKGSLVSEERLLALLHFAKERMLEGAMRIRDGEKAIIPIRKDAENTACTYCPYHSICGFDPDLPAFRFRELDKREEEELWEEIVKRADEKKGGRK